MGWASTAQSPLLLILVFASHFYKEVAGNSHCSFCFLRGGSFVCLLYTWTLKLLHRGNSQFSMGSLRVQVGKWNHWVPVWSLRTCESPLLTSELAEVRLAVESRPTPPIHARLFFF